MTNPRASGNQWARCNSDCGEFRLRVYGSWIMIKTDKHVYVAAAAGNGAIWKPNRQAADIKVVGKQLWNLSNTGAQFNKSYLLMRCINTIQSYKILIIHNRCSPQGMGAKFQRFVHVSDRASGRESVEEASHLGPLIILPEFVLNPWAYFLCRGFGRWQGIHLPHFLHRRTNWIFS